MTSLDFPSDTMDSERRYPFNTVHRRDMTGSVQKIINTACQACYDSRHAMDSEQGHIVADVLRLSVREEVMRAKKQASLLILGLFVVGLVIALPNAAQAQDGGALSSLSGKDRPWAKGVSNDHQNKAREIFQSANELLMQQFFKQAAAKYREALDYWDHPAIHYNMSLALMNLEQPIELYEALKKSLVHGVPPLLEETNYQRAENYLSLISQQISHVVITCKHEGARVTMDGKLLFIGPGAYEGVALAGEHTVTATKKGFLDNNKQVVLSSGQHQRIQLELFTLDDLTYEERRFPKWLPWTVTAAGAALAISGGALHFNARNGFQNFDGQFDSDCAAGCLDSEVPGLVDQLGSATWQQRIGVGAYFVGGAAFATGLVMVIINQPKIIRKEQLETNSGPSLTSIAPLVTPGGSGVQASFQF